MKCVTKKFRGLDMQNNDKELCTKSVLHMQSLFFFCYCFFVFFAVLIAITV